MRAEQGALVRIRSDTFICVRAPANRVFLDSARLDQEYARLIKLTEFDASAFLDNEEVIAEYLAAALEDGNPDVFLAAIGDVAKARGMSAIAAHTGLGRESLYKALAPGAKPRYDTILKVLSSLGVKLTVTVFQSATRVMSREMPRIRRGTT